jgi:HPt (histidine-containing phosphotransfer) domain-containing protein
MKGDREICLAAGMDGYITKPLKIEEFFSAMEKIAAGQQEPNRIYGNVQQYENRKEDIFDREQALVCVDGDRELLREVVAIFWGECPNLLTEIQDAIVGRDSAGLARSSHKLKGSVSNFGARTSCTMAQNLEIMGKTGDFTGAGEVFAALKHEMERLRHALDEFIGGTDREDSDS